MASQPAAFFGELDHIVCCESDVALCGTDVRGQAVDLSPKQTARRPCQQCFDLDAAGKRCGAAMCPGSEE